MVIRKSVVFTGRTGEALSPESTIKGRSELQLTGRTSHLQTAFQTSRRGVPSHPSSSLNRKAGCCDQEEEKQLPY